MKTGRPTKVDRPLYRKIAIPESINAQIELMLWSELEGRVPFGALSSYIEGLIRADLQKRQLKKEVA
jgi:hypothetical protein